MAGSRRPTALQGRGHLGEASPCARVRRAQLLPGGCARRYGSPREPLFDERGIALEKLVSAMRLRARTFKPANSLKLGVSRNRHSIVAHVDQYSGELLSHPSLCAGWSHPSLDLRERVRKKPHRRVRSLSLRSYIRAIVALEREWQTPYKRAVPMVGTLLRCR